MLGWEYPPRFAGGLGKACRGLSLGLAKAGAKVSFMLPTFPERIVEPSLEVVGARESLIAAGWTTQQVESLSIQRVGGLSIIRSEAQMFPYGAHPSGPVTQKIEEILKLDRQIETQIIQTQTVQQTGTPKPVEKVTSSPSGNTEIYGKNLWSEIERFCFAVRQLAEAHEVDVVHAHDWMTFPAAFEVKRVTGLPVFLHVHATEYDRSGENVHSDVFRIEREGFRQATHVFAVSKYTAGILEKLYGVPRGKITVVHNAPDEEAKELNAAPDTDREPNVVFLGRLTFQKGPDHFLKAAAMVAKVNPKARFVICGTGDMFDKLRAMAHDLGIEAQTHFTGFVDPKGVDQILQRSKVLVMPSVSEPFGLVALEAIHNGLPVIMSKQSGVAEVLSRSLHVDFWDHDKLADQILAALRLPDLSRQLVDEGMNQVRGLTWERSARTVMRAYRQQTRRGVHGH